MCCCLLCCFVSVSLADCQHHRLWLQWQGACPGGVRDAAQLHAWRQLPAQRPRKPCCDPHCCAALDLQSACRTAALACEQHCLRPWQLPVKDSASAALCPSHLQDGNPLIKYGERGDKLYLIRYGKVKVLRPDDKGGRIEVAKLGRGSFVGERALIAGVPLLGTAGKQRCGSVSAAWVCTRGEARMGWAPLRRNIP